MATQVPTTASVLKSALHWAHHTTEATMADVTDDIANRSAPGRANPIGSSYAHAVLAEDGIVNGIFQGQAPLWATTWAGKTGIDKPMPTPGGEVPGDLGEWYRTVRVDVAACRAYAQAVYAQSMKFIENASDATLSREMDLPTLGLGKMSAADLFSLLVTQHMNNLCGEISAIKGAHGLKGYPF
ncbi:MAG TPA: DinB family protein [Chloroflexota bacterium]|nr:DinB family protein [Chloroflexota bacterium]